MKRFFLCAFLTVAALVAKSQYNRQLIIEPLLKTDTTALGQGFTYPGIHNDEVTITRITFPPGVSTGWHKHAFPVFAYVLKGELTVALENGRQMVYPEGTSFAEVFSTYHNGINSGEGELVLIAFYLGELGRNLSVPRKTEP